MAAADRRGVWALLATVIALSSLRGPSSAAALDRPLTLAERVILSPRSGMAIAVAAGLVVLVVILADTIARSRVVRAVRPGLEDHPSPGAMHAAARPSLDLGLGDDVRVLVERGSHAYRDPRRPAAVLLGSVIEARAAIGRAVLRGSICLAITLAVIAGNLWAQTPAALLASLEARCQRAASACDVKVDFFGHCRRAMAACDEAAALLHPP